MEDDPLYSLRTKTCQRTSEGTQGVEPGGVASWRPAPLIRRVGLHEDAAYLFIPWEKLLTLIVTIVSIYTRIRRAKDLSDLKPRAFRY